MVGKADLEGLLMPVWIIDTGRIISVLGWLEHCVLARVERLLLILPYGLLIRRYRGFYCCYLAYFDKDLTGAWFYTYFY
jgi:hypothetical protein